MHTSKTTLIVNKRLWLQAQGRFADIERLEEENKKLKSALKTTLDVFSQIIEIEDEEDEAFVEYCRELIK